MAFHIKDIIELVPFSEKGQKKWKREKKDKIFENLGKNV